MEHFLKPRMPYRGKKKSDFQVSEETIFNIYDIFMPWECFLKA